MFLNIVIVSILTFYFIFGIVYRGLFEQSEQDLTEASEWEQPFLIPKGWQLQRIEFGTYQLTPVGEGWTLDGENITEQANLIANNWSGLMIQEIQPYEQLPSGETVLVFVADLKQPIVYRLVADEQMIHIFRMNDQRQFSLPLELKLFIQAN